MEKILKLISEGDESKALALIYKTLFPKIKKMIKKMDGNEQEAKDVFQDVVIKFYRMVLENKFDSMINIEGYLLVMARNTWFHELKRKKRNTDLEEVFFDKLIEVENDQSSFRKEHKDRIIDFFSDLGSRCEKILRLKFYYNYSMKEISEIMKFKNEDSAKTQHYKCKQLLIQKAEKYPAFKQLLYDVAAKSGN